MLLGLIMPSVHPEMDRAVIDVLYSNEGAELGRGTKLLDFTVDLSAAAAYDCPPIASYRIVVREPVWLRRIDVSPGEEVPAGAVIGLFSTIRDEALDTVTARSVRIAIAGIVAPMKWL